MMTSKRKHVSLNMIQKLEILNKLREGYSTRAIIAEYNIGRATVYDLKMKENKLRRYTSQKDNQLDKRKSLRKSENDLLDAAVYKWFKQQRNKGSPLTGTIIKEKALLFNKKLGGSEKFAASEGWLTNWKKRHGVRLLKATEKVSAANKNDGEKFKLRLAKIIKEEELTSAHVYNAGYINLFIKRLPSKTHAAGLEKEAREQQDEHITLLACCNADGNHKLPLMLIGKSKKLRCFKHPEMNTLPVEYCTQEETEINSEIFSTWFHNKFVPRVQENLKKNNLSPMAVLLTYNAPSHLSETTLQREGIRAIFFPRDAIVQPMDQGILESVKRRYRYNILNSLLDKCENNSMETMIKAWKSIKMRDVVFSIAEAWDNVEKITIIKCWKHLWPSSDNNESVDDELLFSNDLFVDMFHRLPGGENVDEENVSRWFDDEENLGKIKKDATEEEIIKSVHEKNEKIDEEKEVENIVRYVELNSKPKTISHAAGAEAAETLLQYLKQIPDASPTSVALVTRLRDDAYQRQTYS